MKRRRGGFTWIEVLIIFVVLAILAAILLPAFVKAPSPNRRATCTAHLKQIGIAFMQYAYEYDERFPPTKFNNAQPVGTVATNDYQPFGWADAIHVYFKTEDIFECPSEPQTDAVSDPTQSGYTDYWYNTHLSKLKLERVENPSQTLMAGDGNDGNDNTNARYNLNRLPLAWIKTEKSPARRHLDVANYLFADGHVKSLKPEAISNLPTRQSKSTFSVR